MLCKISSILNGLPPLAIIWLGPRAIHNYIILIDAREFLGKFGGQPFDFPLVNSSSLCKGNKWACCHPLENPKLFFCSNVPVEKPLVGHKFFIFRRTLRLVACKIAITKVLKGTDHTWSSGFKSLT